MDVIHEAWRFQDGMLPRFRQKVCFMTTVMGTGWGAEAWRLQEGAWPQFRASVHCGIHSNGTQLGFEA